MMGTAKAVNLRRAAFGLAAVVIAICALTLLAYARPNIGIDRWLFPSRLGEQPESYKYPGRM